MAFARNTHNGSMYIPNTLTAKYFYVTLHGVVVLFDKNTNYIKSWDCSEYEKSEIFEYFKNYHKLIEIIIDNE